MYEIDLIAFIRQLLPPNIRKASIIAFCATLFAPVANLLTSLSNYRRHSKLEITATAQVVVLEYNMCRLMGLQVGYIYIAASVNYDFSVLIPDWLTAQQEEQLRQYVHAHKLVGKSFEIIRNV